MIVSSRRSATQPLEKRTESAFDRTRRVIWEPMFWRCPLRLLESGRWRSFWSLEGRRGSGSLSAVIPVLALHHSTWAGAEKWTAWNNLSHRRIAELAGVSPTTVGQVFRELRARGLIDVRGDEQGKGAVYQHRLLRKPFFPDADGKFVKIPGNLFYGGWWALLPTGAAKHLYITLALADVVRDEDAYARGIAERTESLDDEEYIRNLADIERARHPLTLASLATLSGLPRRTLIDARDILTAPIIPSAAPDDPDTAPPVSYVRTGKAEQGSGFWYSPDRRLLRQMVVKAGTLMNPSQLALVRKHCWPSRDSDAE